MDTNAALPLSLTVNGTAYQLTVESRLLLSDLLRHELGLTGTHVGCEHGVCGACTVLMDGEPIRACLLLAIQTQGAAIETIESLAEPDGTLSPLQAAFQNCHALQCGFCTPGMLMTLKAFLKDNPDPTEDAIRQAIAGNLCRCTGYHNIVKAAQSCAAETSA